MKQLSITDTDRLEFLMRFFTVDDVGDDSICPGMVVYADSVSEAFDFGPLADEEVTSLGGWRNPNMRRVIDKAITNEVNAVAAARNSATRKEQ